jgi:hypothetical protein
MTKSSPADDTIKTFATLRVTGDDLDPDEVTQILRITPTTAHRKGEPFRSGPRAGTVIGRTGVWYFSTEHIFDSDRLSDHINALFATIYFEEFVKQNQKPRQEGRVKITYNFTLIGRLARLSQLLKRRSARAVLSCFWHGKLGATPPSIPRYVAAVFKLVPITIETDFDTDESPEPAHVARAS